MIKRLLLLATLGLLSSGCFMVPIALLGPASSGFSTASIMQSAVAQSAGYIVKRKTGKTVAEHAFDALYNSQTAFDATTKVELESTYFPQSSSASLEVTPFVLFQ